MKQLLLAFLAVQLDSATLRPESLAGFEKYMARADQEMRDRGLPSAAPRAGTPQEPAVLPWSGDNPLEAPGALIHDWLGAVFVPGATAGDALAVLRDVPRYPEIYSGDIVEARILSGSGSGGGGGLTAGLWRGLMPR